MQAPVAAEDTEDEEKGAQQQAPESEEVSKSV